jgi:hypothetical protein
VLSGFCVGGIHFLSKRFRLVVIFNLKSNKFNSWHQSTTAGNPEVWVHIGNI